MSYFISKLIDLHEKEDKGKLAIIRRSFTQSATDYNILSVIGRFMPDDLNPQKMKTYMLVAGLFSINPNNTDEKYFNFGATMRHANRASANDGKSNDLKFTSLLNSDVEDIPFKIRQLMKLAKENKTPVNYLQLLKDLLHWDSEENFVQFSWAKEYWQREKDTAEDISAVSTNETESDLN